MLDEVIKILNEIVGADEGEIEADLNLFEAGLLDSFAVIQMFVALEEKFGVTLAVETLPREEIVTPALIARRVEQAL
ncbi:MAG: phosphopantetheine-binding protein [Oscillospiraceae bacterium]|jgi:D-alanine--poly(phosphoribitol) ligase subunit 2|nr:phosphopantetheine-binding protein [Oscillospiraceae bacterium]